MTRPALIPALPFEPTRTAFARHFPGQPIIFGVRRTSGALHSPVTDDLKMAKLLLMVS